MVQHEKFYLNGTWQLKKADETLLCPVEIPGSVLSGLTEHGLLEDPFYRMNEYPARELLKNGTNSIVVKIHSAISYVNEHVSAPGKEIHYTACGAMEGNQYIRKAHSMFGWDWGPQLPDMGK